DEDDEDDEAEYEPGDVNSVDAQQYEAGDVNTISASAVRGSEAASAARSESSIAVLDYLARAMADEPDAVVIRKEERRGSTILRLHVAARDMGRVIGRRGRTAQAIRTLVGVAGARDGVQTVVDIADD
ncbi:MAG TPA: KH domain-containing protein, partial [Acidimicrobiales bacterium]|nr:KH domain-containing protein [Acidimicrobiales bacterium]